MARIDQEPNFSTLDYVIFFGTVAVSLGIGVFFALRKTKAPATIVDYFLAGRKISVVPAAMSLVVTYQSSLMMIGSPAEVYNYGLRYTYFVIGGLFAYVFAAITVVPIFHPLKLTSVYKYFHLRYQDNIVRYLLFVFGLFYYIVYMAAVTYGTCVALEVIIGLPQWSTIIIYTVVTAIYTSIGGMKAVIWTDVLQLVIMMTGVTAILTKATLDVGGFSNVLDLASSRLDMSDFRLDPRIRYQFWNTVFGAFFMFLVGCFTQPGVQRINSTPNVSTARRLYAIAGPLYAVFAFLISIEGIAIFAYYASKRCDPLSASRIANINGIVPLAVSDLFSSLPGLPGLFIASLSSAVLSTLSSSLNSLGAVTYDDIIKVNFPNLPEERATLVSKGIVFLYGIIAMCFTFIVSVLPGSITSVAASLMGCFEGPICGIFLVSMMFKRATSKGVTIAAIVGVATIFWLSLGRMFDESVVNTSPLTPAAIDGCFTSSSVNGSNSGHNHSVDDVTYAYGSASSSLTNDTLKYLTFQATLPMTVDMMDQEMSVLSNLYSISFMCYPLFSCLITILLAIPLSLMTKPPDHVDEKYLFSFRRHVYLPLFGKDSEREVKEVEVDLLDKGKT